MNVVPKLNLNKHPKDCDNLSLVDAKNMIVDRDSLLLTTENSIVVRDDINEQIRNLINTDYKIIYAIPCNKEIVFFCLYASNKIKLIRYNEDLNLCKKYDDINYHGGKFTGTFTYNKNELIISFSEFDYTNNINIPLSVINLKEFNNNFNINLIGHSICPEVIIPSAITIYTKGSARKGWYYIFVRYKLSADNYTQWFNTGKTIFVDSYETSYYERYYLSKSVFGISTPGNEIPVNDNGDTVNVDISNDSDVASVSFNVSFNNLDNRYNNYQIGFINIRKDTTKCYRTNDININIDNYTFSSKSLFEETAINIITSYNNYYNVKTIDSYNNTLYIANYNEFHNITDIEVNDIKVTLNGTRFNYDNSSTINNITRNTSGRPGLTKRFFGYLPKYTLNNDTDKYFSLDYFPKDTNKGNIAFKQFIFWIVEKELQHHTYNAIKNGQATFNINNTDIILFSYNNVEYECYANNIYYVVDIDNSNNNYYNFITTNGQEYNIYDANTINESLTNNFILLAINGKQINFDYWDTNYGIIIRPVVIAMDNLIYTEQIDNIDIITNDILNTNCILPNEYYNIFIHFVNKYGETTKGFNLNNFASIHINDDIKIVNNNIGDTLVYTTNKCNKISIKLSKLPNNYIGYFVTYEKFEPHIIHKGAIYKNKFISEHLNIDATNGLNFNFNILRVYDNTTDNKNILDTYNEYNIASKSLYIADTYNNIGFPTNIELTLTAGSNNNLENTYLHKAYLINNDVNNLYVNKYKTLIQCSKVIYTTNEYVDLEINNAFNTNIRAFKFKDTVTTHDSNGHITFLDKVTIYFNNTTKAFQSLYKVHRTTNANNKTKSYWVYNIFELFKYKDYVNVPTESHQYLNNPQVIFFPISGLNDPNDWNKSFEVGCITEMKNTIDLFQQKNPAVYDMCPKVYINYIKEDNVETQFSKTIRRSNVIADESNYIGWRFFESDNYKNIIENKGNIIKLTSAGNMMLVHTEHSLFQFKTDQVLKSNDENDVAISNNDIWDLNYQEIFTSELGFAGINDINHAILGQFGYVFYEQDKGRIFRYDNSSIQQIDIDINNYIRKLKDKYRNLSIVDDIDRMRLLFNFYQDNIKETLSYNYKINAFVSRHDYNDSFGYTTKNKVYLLDNITQSDIKTYSDTEYNHYNGINESYVAFIINTDYDMIKMLEYIKYKFNKTINTDDILPCSKRDAYYSGELIQILADECDTGEMNIYIDNPRQTINRVQDFNKPYRELGTWNFNYIRDISKGAPNPWPVKGSDALPRFYGNWFIVKFTFTPATINNSCVEIESFNYHYVKNLT